jgi:hypothetical protein
MICRKNRVFSTLAGSYVEKIKILRHTNLCFSLNLFIVKVGNVIFQGIAVSMEKKDKARSIWYF